MVDLGEAPAFAPDRTRALIVAIVLVALFAIARPYAAIPLGPSYPIFSIVIALSIAAFAITALLLWAQGRVTESVPLTVLATGYGLTAIVMLPYMLFYRGLWPQLAQLFSADSQTSSWLWVEWHALFLLSAVAYFITRGGDVLFVDRAAFRRFRALMLRIGAAIVVATVPAFIWIDGLPVLTANNGFTPLFDAISYGLTALALLTIVLAYRTSRFRSILDAWLAIACLSMFVDLALQHASHQFSAGWYASRVGILIAASAVLWILLFQTATLYERLAATAERLHADSLTDALTGLANRRRFDQRLDEALRDCARGTRPVALLMIDIDNFKVYNDTFGHQAGDDCLRRVAALLQNNVGRARDLVARTGGEEMTVVMPEVDRAGALVVAERLRSAVQAAGMPQGPDAIHPVVTISVGIGATEDPAQTTPDELVAAADAGLYEAKRQGRNRVAGTLSAAPA